MERAASENTKRVIKSSVFFYLIICLIFKFLIEDENVHFEALVVGDVSRLQVGEKAFNPLNEESNTIRHLLALLGAHYILHVSRIRVNKS